ncbi:hypothetical protein CEXT_468291, partial [Caerostris extrusa]
EGQDNETPGTIIMHAEEQKYETSCDEYCTKACKACVKLGISLSRISKINNLLISKVVKGDILLGFSRELLAKGSTERGKTKFYPDFSHLLTKGGLRTCSGLRPLLERAENSSPQAAMQLLI